MPCARLLIRRKCQPLPQPSSQKASKVPPLNSDTTKLLPSESKLQQAVMKIFSLSENHLRSCSVCCSRLHKFVLRTCRSALQILHKACEVARRYNYFPGGMALVWATYYESCISSDQSCINEWNAMQDLESTRPDSPALFVDKSVLNFIILSEKVGLAHKRNLTFSLSFLLSIYKYLQMFFFHYCG